MTDDMAKLIVSFDVQARSIDERVSCASVRKRDDVKWSEIEALITYYEDEDKVHFGCSRGFHHTVEGAIERALAEFRTVSSGFVEAARKRNECIVCGCAGVVTTGEGRMCREHGVRWLEGEASVSEMLAESEERDMG